MKTFSLLDNRRRHEWAVRQHGIEHSTLASIVRFQGIAKADGKIGNRGKLSNGRLSTMRLAGIVLALSCMLPMAGCTREPAPRLLPTQLPASVAFEPAADPAAVALPALVQAERTAARERNAELLSLLWSPDARIVDSRGTKDPSDDYIWQGRAAILDRYRLAVFPAPPPPFAEPVAFEVVREGDIATAVLGSDRWRFQFADGRWWLLELAY